VNLKNRITDQHQENGFVGQKELLSALRKMTIIIRLVHNHQKRPVRDTRNVTKTLFLVWESQKRVKCMSFTYGGKEWLQMTC